MSVVTAAAAAPGHVAVVGGGIVGASIAWHLAGQTNVTIIAENVGGVATRNSFAWLNAASGDSQSYYNFRLRSLDHWREMESAVPGLPIYWGGGLKWDEGPEELEQYREKVAGWGYDIIKVDQSGIREKEPRIASVPEWGLFAPGEGTLEAAAAAELLVREAVQRGAQLIEATATGLVKDGDRVAGVAVAGRGDVAADHVVVAAGLGTVPLLARAGVDVPVTARAGMLVNTKPVAGPRLLNTLLYIPELHLRQTLDGVVRSGGDDVLTDDPDADAAALFAKVQAAVVGGDQLEFDYYTLGQRPTPEDGLPILGPTGLDGATVAVMHSGVTNAALVGEIISKLVLTGEKDPIMDDYLLSRFSQ